MGIQKDQDTSTEPAYRVEVLGSLGQMEKLRSQWAEWSRHPNADIDFYALVTELRKEEAAPLLLAVLSEGKPVALLAGFAECAKQEVRLGYLRLTKLKVSRLAFGGVMGETSPRIAQALVSEIVSRLKEGNHDVVEIGPIRTDSDLYQAAKRVPNTFMRGHFAKGNPHWRMNVPATMEEFYAKRSKKHRYWLKRIQRILEENHPGKVRIQQFQGKDEIKTFAMHAEQVAQMTYQRRIGAGFVNNREYQARLELAARKGWLRAYVLYIDQQPRAFWAGSLYKNVFFLAWTGYDPALRHYELGTILFLRLLGDLATEQVHTIDFGYGTADYKERFGDQGWTEDVASIFAPRLRGMYLNGVTTLHGCCSRASKRLLKCWNMENWLKRVWRRKLTNRG